MPTGVQAIVPVGEWWLRLARRLIEHDTRSLTTLGHDLAKRIPGKRKPFDHGRLSRFREGKVGATLELVVALCEEYEALPQPVFLARDEAESIELSGVARKYDPKAAPASDAPAAARTPTETLAEIISFPVRARTKQQRATAQRQARSRAR